MSVDDAVTVAHRAIQTKSKVINISNRNLVTIPPVVWTISTLEQLICIGNQVLTIPDDCARLASLKVLDIRGNRLKSISPAIAMVSNLQQLLVSNNQLTTLPAGLGDLDNVKLIDARGNPITSLPSQLYRHLRTRILLVDEPIRNQILGASFDDRTGQRTPPESPQQRSVSPPRHYPTPVNTAARATVLQPDATQSSAYAALTQAAGVPSRRQLTPLHLVSKPGPPEAAVDTGDTEEEPRPLPPLAQTQRFAQQQQQQQHQEQHQEQQKWQPEQQQQQHAVPIQQPQTIQQARRISEQDTYSRMSEQRHDSLNRSNDLPSELIRPQSPRSALPAFERLSEMQTFTSTRLEGLLRRSYEQGPSPDREERNERQERQYYQPPTQQRDSAPLNERDVRIQQELQRRERMRQHQQQQQQFGHHDDDEISALDPGDERTRVWDGQDPYGSRPPPERAAPIPPSASFQQYQQQLYPQSQFGSSRPQSPRSQSSRPQSPLSFASRSSTTSTSRFSHRASSPQPAQLAANTQAYLANVTEKDFDYQRVLSRHREVPRYGSTSQTTASATVPAAVPTSPRSPFTGSVPNLDRTSVENSATTTPVIQPPMYVTAATSPLLRSPKQSVSPYAAQPSAPVVDEAQLQLITFLTDRIPRLEAQVRQVTDENAQLRAQITDSSRVTELSERLQMFASLMQRLPQEQVAQWTLDDVMMLFDSESLRQSEAVLKQTQESLKSVQQQLEREQAANAQLRSSLAEMQASNSSSVSTARALQQRVRHVAQHQGSGAELQHRLTRTLNDMLRDMGMYQQDFGKQ